MKKMEIYFYSIKMGKQTLKFGDIIIKKNFMLLNKQLL